MANCGTAYVDDEPGGGRLAAAVPGCPAFAVVTGFSPVPGAFSAVQATVELTGSRTWRGRSCRRVSSPQARFGASGLFPSGIASKPDSRS